MNSAVSSLPGGQDILTVHAFRRLRKEDLRHPGGPPDTSTQPLTMAEEEQAAFFEKTFQIYFLRATFKFMSLLPSSVMESLLQGLSW